MAAQLVLAKSSLDSRITIAVLVGTKTFGKGLVQSVRGLGDGSGLAVTMPSYFSPSGRDINKAGIAPDVVVGLTDAQSLAARARQSWHTSRLR